MSSSCVYIISISDISSRCTYFTRPSREKLALAILISDQNCHEFRLLLFHVHYTYITLI